MALPVVTLMATGRARGPAAYHGPAAAETATATVVVVVDDGAKAPPSVTGARRARASPPSAFNGRRQGGDGCGGVATAAW